MSTLAVLGVAETHTEETDHSAVEAEHAVSVDARHAGQDAHFEGSDLELRSRCPTCVLTDQGRVTLSTPGARVTPPTGRELFAGTLTSSPTDSENGLALSRAPPLH